MTRKTSDQLLQEARVVVTQMEVADAMTLVKNKDFVFVDVRERHERAEGFIPGSVHAPRGMLEFHLDAASSFHLPELASGRHLIFYCGSGGRSTLAAHTAHSMGLSNCHSLAGGFRQWKSSAGPVALAPAKDA